MLWRPKVQPIQMSAQNVEYLYNTGTIKTIRPMVDEHQDVLTNTHTIMPYTDNSGTSCSLSCPACGAYSCRIMPGYPHRFQDEVHSLAAILDAALDVVHTVLLPYLNI